MNPSNPSNTRSATLVAAFLSLASLAACGPISANQSPVLVPPQVEVTSQSLANDIAVRTPVVARMGPGQLVVNVTVDNLTNDPMVLEYQYEFLNKGMLKQDWTGWMTFRIPPRSEATVPDFKSMEPEVDDFRIRFRWAQAN